MSKVVIGLLAGGALLAPAGCVEIVVEDGGSRPVGIYDPTVSDAAPYHGSGYYVDEWVEEVWVEDWYWLQDEGWYYDEYYDDLYYDQWYGDWYYGGDWGGYWDYDWAYWF